MLERRDEEHERLRDHGDEQDLVAVGKVQQLEERTDNHDGGTPAIEEVQHSFTLLAGEKHLQPILISSIFSHCLLTLH